MNYIVKFIVLFSFLNLFSNSFAQEIVDASVLNQRFQLVKEQLLERNIPYDFKQLQANKPIKSQDFNENFVKILLIDPLINLYSFSPQQAVELYKIDYNFNQINNLIMTKLSKISCNIDNGLGFRHYNINLQTWDSECLVDSCTSGFYPNQDYTACTPNNSIACDNQYDPSYNLVGYGFLNYNYTTQTESCKISSCVSSAYQLNPTSNQCECSDPSNCFVSIAQINNDIASINSVLAEASQDPIDSMPTSQAINQNLLNNSMAQVKKYDPNNLITNFGNQNITNNQWTIQNSEAMRLVQSYKNLCINFNNLGLADGSATCDLALKLKNSFTFLNEYFPFYSDSAVSFSLSERQFLSYSDLNTLINNFNNKTNKVAVINNYAANETIASSSLNNKLVNLKANIQNKLEVTLGTYNPYSRVGIASFNNNETSANQSVAFKLSNTSYSTISITNTLNGTSCLRNEYCKVSFSGHNTGTLNLVQLLAIDNQGVQTSFPLRIVVESEAQNPPNRSGDYGCHNADGASHADRNIWACQGGKNACNYFCYKYGTGGGCSSSSNPLALFNAYYNASGKYQYSTYVITTGDLRSGCGGTYVYAFRITYYRQQYYLSP